MTWQKRLTQARLAKKLSKSDLARLVHVSPSAVTQWENEGGTESIKGENLTAVCAALDISPEWLLNKKGEMSPKAAEKSAEPVAEKASDMPQFRVALHYSNSGNAEEDTVAEIIIAAPTSTEAAEKARKFMQDHYPNVDDSKCWAWVVTPNPGGKAPERVS